MRRGDIWEADIGGKAGKRPVLILTRSGVIPYLSKVVVAEITTQGKGYPTQIAIHQHGNLRHPSFVSAESLHSLPKERLKRYLGELPSALLYQVSQAIIFALDLTADE
ncbi:MAG: type II toxin-antitoxin system PemK/MazF family toxin [Deltaproteobacteria bacterium]|nr:type II toxin-antitoxin system PemK/MazF family toxin [Deltaproteobacteria bacterium]